MMHQPVDNEDARFYAAETLLILNGNDGRAVLGSPWAASSGVGTPLPGGQGGHRGCANSHDGQPAPPRLGVRRASHTGAK
jgi:hypothetical protein